MPPGLACAALPGCGGGSGLHQENSAPLPARRPRARGAVSDAVRAERSPLDQQGLGHRRCARPSGGRAPAASPPRSPARGWLRPAASRRAAQSPATRRRRASGRPAPAASSRAARQPAGPRQAPRPRPRAPRPEPRRRPPHLRGAAAAARPPRAVRRGRGRRPRPRPPATCASQPAGPQGRRQVRPHSAGCRRPRASGTPRAARAAARARSSGPWPGRPA
mmetsp:Transcript_72931/g.226641  ORF Transcript_72931/g.226641 Transcript_72931/m.226641 type:complete len:220 (+) Transcript_72931:161-820(+)